MNKKILALLMIGILFLLMGVASAAIKYQDPLNGVSEDAFKEQCVEITYKDLKVDNSLINTSVMLVGKVSMAADNTMVFLVDGDSSQQVIVNLPPDKDNSKYKKYEGLEATIYGTFQGVDNFGFSGECPYVSIATIE